MRDGFGFIIFLGILFVGWLMFSSKTDKELFLGYAWAAMIGGGVIYYGFKFITR